MAHFSAKQIILAIRCVTLLSSCLASSGVLAKGAQLSLVQELRPYLAENFYLDRAKSRVEKRTGQQLKFFTNKTQELHQSEWHSLRAEQLSQLTIKEGVSMLELEDYAAHLYQLSLIQAGSD